MAIKCFYKCITKQAKQLTTLFATAAKKAVREGLGTRLQNNTFSVITNYNKPARVSQ